MGVVGGVQKCIFCCTFCICAYLSALLSLDFSFLIFFEKILGCQGLWCYHFMAGVHCFADIDQADLLGGGGELLGWLAEKIIFCICIFSDFHGFSGYFLIALGPISLIYSCLIDSCQEL